jgi:putative tryptophan/tyrosine transport system substrate-binding protein
MRRREFLSIVSGAVVAAPLVGRAEQTGRTYRLGALIPATRDDVGTVAFFDELRLQGYVEGTNLQVLPGGFGVSRDQIDEKVAAVMKASPDVIISGPDQYTRAFQQVTTTIPILGMSEDMVGEGLVPSLARPGGNTTGISILSPDLDGKRQELLIEAVPGVNKIATLVDSARTGQEHVQRMQSAARARGVEVLVLGASAPDQVLSTIDAAKAAGAGAINFLAAPLFTVNANYFLDHLTTLRLPAIHNWPEIAEEGGLLSYGARFVEVFRQRARMVAKVLRGAKPADIPVEQPTRFELVINLKAARAIGHEIPPKLVLRADKLIE